MCRRKEGTLYLSYTSEYKFHPKTSHIFFVTSLGQATVFFLSGRLQELFNWYPSFHPYLEHYSPPRDWNDLLKTERACQPPAQHSPTDSHLMQSKAMEADLIPPSCFSSPPHPSSCTSARNISHLRALCTASYTFRSVLLTASHTEFHMCGL